MKWKLEKFISVTLLMSLVLSVISPSTLAVYATAPQVESEAEKETVKIEEGLISETETQKTECMEPLETEDFEPELPKTEFSEIEPGNDSFTETGQTEEKTEQTQEIVGQAESQTPEKETEEIPDIEGEISDEKEEDTESLKEEIGETLQKEPDMDAPDKQDFDTESNHEEIQMTELVEITLTRELLESSDEVPDPEAAGTVQNLKVDAFNPMQEDMKLRIYFWDYQGSETNGKMIPEELLTEACNEITFPTCNEDGSFPVMITNQEGNIWNASAYLCETREAEKLTARYIEMDIPKGDMLTGTFPLLNDQAETVVASAIVSPENATNVFEKCIIGWKEKVAEESKENTEPSAAPEKSDELQEQEEKEKLPEETQQKEPTQEEKDILSEIVPQNLCIEDFSSRRLLVMTADPQNILSSDAVIGSYGNIYLIEYETVERCMAAYVYYKEIVDAVEPDAFLEIASDISDMEIEEIPKENAYNPVTALSEMEGAVFLPDGKNRVIALLDTGASASENVIGRVSLIDDVLEGHAHGNEMVSAMTGANPNAEILSIRVMGNDGRGTVSAIVAGMEYAIEQGASIINLSLSSKRNLMNAVLEAEIQKAISMGIIVVGAAGNNGADAIDYMPGSVTEAVIVGSCNEKGVRVSSSNYGATVDYNVVAGTTSEAAAKFSGQVSMTGLEGIPLNKGLVYTTDYVAAPPKTEEMEMSKTEESDLMEEESSDMAGMEEDGPYPGKGSTVSETHKIWVRDTEFDFAGYNPYQEDERVSVSCADEIPEHTIAVGERFQVPYICTRKDVENYSWNLFVTFEYTDDRSLATQGSALLENLMPSSVTQDRNEGYGGIVPKYRGETVSGREFTVLKDDSEFDIYGLLIDYNPETFKVNNLADDGGFDVAKEGTYTVTYEMSYFLYPEYTWYVANSVTVVAKENLEPGIYLTSTESTILFRRETDSHFSGYGDLVKVGTEDLFTITCIDPEYDVKLTSSSKEMTTDCCMISDNGDGSRNLRVELPKDLNEAVIFSMYRPDYQSAKFFTGGGWASGDDFQLEELSISQLSDTDMEHLEDIALGKTEKDGDAYLETAATWSTVDSKKIKGQVTTGDANTTNHSYVSGSVGGCNTGTAQISQKRSEIDAWITEQGYDIDPEKLTNFNVNCASGHDYLGLWPHSSYDVTFRCYIQKRGEDYRLKIICSLHPGSDQHGNYQGFYGSKTYSSLTNGAKLRVYKRFAYPEFMEINPDKYGYLKTTFAIYPESAYNPTTKVLDTSVTPEGTIILNEKEDDTVYGDSDILDPGTYYVIETRRIAGCTQNTDIYGPVVITEKDSGVVKLHEKVNNADYDSMASNNWIYNYPMYFNGKLLTKVDDSGLPVEGAIYKVEYSTEGSDAFSPKRTWYFKTDKNGVLSYDHAHYVESFTDQGKTYQSDAIIENPKKTVPMLPFGFVRIKEVKPPSDVYELDLNTYMVELVAQKDAAGAYTIRKLAVKGDIPTSVDSLRYWKLKVEKASKASPEILNLKPYSLANATFGVFADSACTKRVQLYSDQKLTEKVADNVLRTNEEGKTPVYYLKAGVGTSTYYVKELTAPAGHQVAEKTVSVTVTMPADALKQKTASFTEGFSEPYDFMELDALVEKLSMHGKPIPGVVFKVCYYDDSTANAGQLKKTWYLKSDTKGKVYMDPKHVYQEDAAMKSDTFYTDPSSGKIILPIGGYVTIQEVKAPANYQIDDTIHGFATKKQKLTVKRLYNELVPGKIRIKKYDKTGTNPLAGVEFEIKFVKAAETDTGLAKPYKRLLKEGETKRFQTDKKGEIAFENLDHGTYEITEVKTVPGQTLLKDKITVKLPITMTKAEAEKYGNVDFKSAKEDSGYTGKWFFYDCLYEITNEPQFILPQTGGFGGWSYGFIGVALLALAGGILLFTRKKSTA
ncbi:SpaA isopeptide-forming pilin-related protein [Parablautia sp. Marseille-Q6255]|uniref:SpaA isopeptide-forming pilin-related protein n=1 Tax=Parablautia sp. Marseille-Q6255 TaxID=3039593 RepID=UPI0024BD16DE|nr:SpaA isopeptide-forming pilin-related protein [Parablautia sp. Marseille-Q6255]